MYCGVSRPGWRWGRWLAWLWCCGLVPACAPVSASQPGYLEPVAVCEVVDPRLDEASGLAAARRNADCYYTHNDSQGAPHVYVLNRQGRIQATIRLVGAENVDWEDISLAPGAKPDTYDICVADIGDNKARRSEIVIYRVPEPDVSAAAGGSIDVRPETIRCKYEDGPTDAEGFAVDPRTGDGYVFGKRFDGTCHVYRLPAPWPSSGVALLKRAGTLAFPPQAPPLERVVTAADIAPDGRRLVTRSYLGGWEWRLPAETGGEALAPSFAQRPAALPLPEEPQGEALCFSADGKALLTISERLPTTLYEVRAAKNEAPVAP